VHGAKSFLIGAILSALFDRKDRALSGTSALAAPETAKVERSTLFPSPLAATLRWSVDCSPARIVRRAFRLRATREGEAVQNQTDPEDTLERREESARHVLHAYRERRRRRRGEDTYFGSTECFIEPAETVPESPERARRRSELMDEAHEIGMPRDLAEMLYDVAQEEGLDPGLAFELVRTGLGVCPPADGISTESIAPATDKYLPPWMFPASPPDHMMRERALHLSFRLLRSLLEDSLDVDDAFHSFAHQPGVGHCGY
jgi:hypothetical protein